jgi:hypothetical protein
MEKCISIPHDRKKNVCFPSHKKNRFWLRKVLNFFLRAQWKSQPPLPIRKWLLPNKVIGTKLQLVPVVEVCLYWPTSFLFPWIAFYIKYSDSCLFVCLLKLDCKRGYNDYILYQDAICNWSSSNLYVPPFSTLKLSPLLFEVLNDFTHVNDNS